MVLKCSIFLCAVLCSLILTEALPATRNLHRRLQKRSGMRLCGRMLVEALAAVCQNEYYGPSHIKRNYNAENYPDWESVYQDGIFDPQTALDFFNMNQITRTVRGVADECCVKSCSFLQLVSYCSPTTGK